MLGCMSYRPYPDVDRAYAQLRRGRRRVPPSEFQLRLAGQANATLEAAGRAVEPLVRGMRSNVARLSSPQNFPVGEYRISTR